jgi:hypothetical protein
VDNRTVKELVAKLAAAKLTPNSIVERKSHLIAIQLVLGSPVMEADGASARQSQDFWVKCCPRNMTGKLMV